MLIGTYIDPVFGTVNRSLFTQLRLSTENPNFGNNPIIDSVVLSLAYGIPAFYGKQPLSQQNISVYQLSEGIESGATYYANDSLPYHLTDLASAVAFIPQPDKNITIDNQALLPQLRVLLSSSFGQEILNRSDIDLITNVAFQNYLKGLYITTKNSTGLNTGDGALLRFKLEDPQTKITLYYHTNSTSGNSFDIPIGGNYYFTQIKHNHSNADADFVSQKNNTSFSQNQIVYLQPAGASVKVTMPYLSQLLDSGQITINKAELAIKANTSPTYNTSVFTAPEKLKLLGINDDGSTYSIPDEFEGEYYYDGNYNFTSGAYTFHIARYIQRVLTGKLKNNGLLLQPINEIIRPERTVLGGGGPLDNVYKMGLKITYTRMP